MSKAAKMDVLEELHAAVAEVLLEKVKSGEISAAELAQVTKFLKDNGIEPARDADHSALNELADRIGNISDEEVSDFLTFN